MEKTKRVYIKTLPTFIGAALIMVLVGCTTAVNPTQPGFRSYPTLSLLTPQADRFKTVSKDGVEIACPENWQTYSSDPSLVYSVSRIETIRIVIGVLPAAAQSYYDSLVNWGTVVPTTVAGYPAYRNDYTYSYGGHMVTNICVSAVHGGKACHFMFLCDVSAMGDFEPVFQYVLNSLKFIEENPGIG